MNPWYRFFGVLDFLNFLRSLLILSTHIRLGFGGLSYLGLFNAIGYSALIISFVFSGYFTLRKKRVGLLIYFVQLPLRLYFYSFSFGIINDLFTGHILKVDFTPMLIFLGFLEIIRLIYSIRQYNYFQKR